MRRRKPRCSNCRIVGHRKNQCYGYWENNKGLKAIHKALDSLCTEELTDERDRYKKALEDIIKQPYEIMSNTQAEINMWKIAKEALESK